MRFLAAADIHIGRVPSLPEDHPGAHGRGAWLAVVECAITRAVDAVLLAGDIVQSENGFFEAFGALSTGVARLKAAGIPVIGIAGNHDAGIAHKIAQEIPGMTLLGRNGRWEDYDFNGLIIKGWSFPDSSYTRNPMESFEVPQAGVPWIGLLHCDLDGPSTSRYAPVPSGDLERTGGDWILGHTHVGGVRGRYSRAFYCGSTFALDLSEEGAHGAWLIEVGDEGRITSKEHVRLSPWVYETLTVDAEGVGDLDGLRSRVATTMQKSSRDSGLADLGSVYYTLRFEGQCRMAGRIMRELASAGLEDLRLGETGACVMPSGKLYDDTQAELDLAGLAAEHGAIGTLAGLILALNTGGSEPEGLAGTLSEVGGWIGDLTPLSVAEWTKTSGPPTHTDPKKVVQRAANRLLLSLVAQREERGTR